jgi:hypothetical protein
LFLLLGISSWSSTRRSCESEVAPTLLVLEASTIGVAVIWTLETSEADLTWDWAKQVVTVFSTILELLVSIGFVSLTFNVSLTIVSGSL